MNRKFVAKSNYVLRKILNSEENIDIVKDLVEAILDIEIQEIKLNPYLKKREQYLPSEENFGIVDCRIKTNDEDMNIGIQFVDGIYVQTKMLLYYAQIHLNQLEYDDNRHLARTVTINFLDFNLFKTLNFEKRITIQTNDKDLQTKEIEVHVIELPKFKNRGKIMNRKEEWIFYMKGCTEEELENIKQSNNFINRLDEKLEKYWQEEKLE